MPDTTMAQPALAPRQGPNLDAKPHASVGIGFAVMLVGGLGYMAYSVLRDVSGAGGPVLATGAIMLLGVALVTALGFEFVNGFHDTANAVATVIYTHSLPAQVAVIWSGFFNFLGVLTSSGAVAFTVVSLLPVEPDLAGRQRRGLRDDLRAADRGHHLEPGNLGAGTAGEPRPTP